MWSCVEYLAAPRGRSIQNTKLMTVITREGKVVKVMLFYKKTILFVCSLNAQSDVSIKSPKN